MTTKVKVISDSETLKNDGRTMKRVFGNVMSLMLLMAVLTFKTSLAAIPQDDTTANDPQLVVKQTTAAEGEKKKANFIDTTAAGTKPASVNVNKSGLPLVIELNKEAFTQADLEVFENFRKQFETLDFSFLKKATTEADQEILNKFVADNLLVNGFNLYQFSTADNEILYQFEKKHRPAIQITVPDFAGTDELIIKRFNKENGPKITLNILNSESVSKADAEILEMFNRNNCTSTAKQ